MQRGSRFHRGGRGFRRGHQQSYSSSREPRVTNRRDDDEQGAGSSGFRSSNRPPAGLRGRDIGMWYAQRGTKRKQHQQRLEVHVDENIQRRTEGLLRHAERNSVSGSEEHKPPRDARDYFASAQDARVDEDNVNIANEEESDISFAELYRDNVLANANFNPANSLNEAGKETLMIRDEVLDTQFADDLMRRRAGGPLEDFRRKLPAFNMKLELIDMIGDNQVVVISGETGCGKTTQVPQFVLDDMIASHRGSVCNIICTQPRRISALSVSKRVASERGENLGNSVGYSIRLDSRLPRSHSSITFCTTGVLLRRMCSDSSLKTVSHVIVDEVHERDIQTDFLLILLRDLIIRRPDLKVVLMSATLNAEAFSKYFNSAPCMKIPGFTFPVEDVFLEDILKHISYLPERHLTTGFKRSYGPRRHNATEDLDELILWCDGDPSFAQLDAQAQFTMQTMNYEVIHPKLVTNLVKYICTDKPPGAILVFLPGWADIKEVKKLLDNILHQARIECNIIPLHSLMPTAQQNSIFLRPPEGVRKIVLATNIAETSITIDDVVYVIDGGKIKITDYDSESNLDSLKVHWISKANMTQRRGRAGRVQPGVCYHLFTWFHKDKLDDELEPEMLRSRLENVCLDVKMLKQGGIVKFLMKAVDCPSEESINKSIQILKDLSALDTDENLTPLGFHLAQLPLDPHIGKMVIMSAIFCCLDPILTIAACLSFKEPFQVPLDKEKIVDGIRRHFDNGQNSDHIMLYNVIKGYEEAGDKNRFVYDNFISRSNLEMILKMKTQFAEQLHQKKYISSCSPKNQAANRNSGNMSLVKAILCSGLYPKVGMVQPSRKTVVRTKEHRRVYLHAKSVNERKGHADLGQWLVYYQMVKTNAIQLYDCTAMPALPIMFFGGVLSRRMEKPDSLEPYEAVIVDDWITFKCSWQQATFIEKMRSELDAVLSSKITSAGVTCWDTNTKEGAVLHSLVNLISTDSTQKTDY